MTVTEQELSKKNSNNSSSGEVVQPAQNSSESESSGQCDRRCMTATSPPSECECRCGGKNHGHTKTLDQFSDTSDNQFDELDEIGDNEAERRQTYIKEYEHDCLLCSAAPDYPWVICRADPQWDAIPNPPEEVDYVDVCNQCYEKWIIGGLA